MNKNFKNNFVKLYEKIKEFFKSTSNDFSIMDIEDGLAKYSSNWWFMRALKWLAASCLAVITLFLWGCSGAAVTKYYPVSVPVRCSVEIPDKPEYSEDTVVTNLNILSYAEKLLSALKACKDGGLND